MARPNLSTTQLAFLLVGSALCGSILGNIGFSFADDDPATSTLVQDGIVVPYDGYLMLDSAPLNSTAQDLEFSLYEAASGGSPQWVETQTVSVNNGRFSVALGKGTKLSSSPANATFNEVILDAKKLYIAIKVKDAQGTFVELAGRQAIEMAPFAAWSATSADFKVERNLNVEGNARVENGMTVTGLTALLGNVASSGAIDISGSITARGGIEITNGNLDVQGGDITMDDGDIRLVETITGSALNGLRLYGTGSASGTPSLSIGQNHTLDARGDLRLAGGTLLMGSGSIFSVPAALQTSGTTLEINPNGDFTSGVRVESDASITGNLEVVGKYNNLDNSFTMSHYDINSGTRDMISTADGFCFLTEVYMDAHYLNPQPMACKIAPNNGVWRLTVTQGNQSGDIDNTNCEARCVRWTR